MSALDGGFDAKVCAHTEFIGQPAGFTPTSWRCVDCGLTMTAGEFEIRRELKYPSQFADELSTLRQRAERAEAELAKKNAQINEQISDERMLRISAQSTIAELNVTVAELREAIELTLSELDWGNSAFVPQEFADNVLRAALGGAP